MNNAQRQARKDLMVFREFAMVCQLPLLGDSAQERPVPEPDILCELSNSDKLAFELGQAEDVTTYTNAKGQVYEQSVQYKESRPGNHFSVVGLSIVDRVKKKLAKSYVTDHPIHLLVWSDAASTTELSIWQEHDEMSSEENKLKTLLAKGMGPFDRIWVYGRVKKAIVFDSDTIAHS